MDINFETILLLLNDHLHNAYILLNKNDLNK
jgi:hypothetical protein